MDPKNFNQVGVSLNFILIQRIGTTRMFYEVLIPYIMIYFLLGQTLKLFLRYQITKPYSSQFHLTLG